MKVYNIIRGEIPFFLFLLFLLFFNIIARSDEIKSKEYDRILKESQNIKDEKERINFVAKNVLEGLIHLTIPSGIALDEKYFLAVCELDVKKNHPKDFEYWIQEYCYRIFKDIYYFTTGSGYFVNKDFKYANGLDYRTI